MGYPVYKRVLIKISGEALAHDNKNGDLYDFAFMDKVASVIKKCADEGVQVAVIVGAGNIWRGAKGTAISRCRGDHMGMLATVINALALQDTFLRAGIDAKVLSSVEMNTFADFYTQRDANDMLNAGKVVILAGGSGVPFFSTDTPAVVRAAEIGADAVLMAKNVDGLYTADPKVDPTAQKIEDITYSEILEKNLRAFDMTAVSFCNDNDITSFAFALSNPDNIYDIIMGKKTGTKMHK
ncbi:MAG: UMP kinase [Ruminococcaceae bacterium]|nr:UMP kinase [Oscillospiraceae bacterium]